MADIASGSVSWPHEKDFNNKNICNKCLKNGTPLCVIDNYYKKNIITSCSGFKQKKASIITGVDSYPKIEPWYINNVYNKNNFKEKTIRTIIYSTPKKKEGDFYEKYIDSGEQYIWEKIIKEKRNNKIEIFGGLKKNMNKTNSTKIDILKNKIEHFKKEREKKIEEITKIYKKDILLKECNGWSRKIIDYIINEENLSIKDKKHIKYDKMAVILDSIRLDNGADYSYHKKYGENPFNYKCRYLMEIEKNDWNLFEQSFNLIKKHIDGFLIEEYNKELDFFTNEKDLIICERCGTTNISKSNYCNNCGKEL